jgi:hypothetical protein
MTTIAFIKPGAHIVFCPATKNSNALHKAFDIYVSDVELDPNIPVSNNLYLSTVPPALENVLRYWSVRQQFEINGTNSNIRAVGKYKLGTATGEVEFFNHLRNQSITVTGTDLKECVQLRDLILAGSIAPCVPHSGPQVKSPALSIKDAAHKLIEALFLAWDRARLRLA